MDIKNILISESWGSVNPEALERGIGGREGALLYLSREFCRAGNNITNFVNVEESSRIYEGDFYHEYIPLSLAKPILKNFPTDICIAWETPSAFDDPKIKENVKLKLCEMQVCHLSDKEMLAASQNLDFMCALSPWHKNFLLHSGLNMQNEKVLVFPNGIRLERYPKEAIMKKITKKIGKNPKFVYSSSPDRGLWYLLQIWPYIREEYPKAELSVCYGVDKWVNLLKWSHGRIGEMALGIIELINQPGVKNIGKIGQTQLSKLQLEADAWIYPFDPMSPTESGAISAIENAAAGNPIITTDADCMEEEFGRIGNIIKLPFVAQEFAEKTIKILNDQPYMEYMRIVGRTFAENRDWNVIAKSWLELFEREVNKYGKSSY